MTNHHPHPIPIREGGSFFIPAVALAVAFAVAGPGRGRHAAGAVA